MTEDQRELLEEARDSVAAAKLLLTGGYPEPRGSNPLVRTASASVGISVARPDPHQIV